MEYYANESYKDYLAHFGVKGMRWGVRRYQNEDGTLTEEGERRYNTGSAKRIAKRIQKDINQIQNSTDYKMSKYKLERSNRMLERQAKAERKWEGTEAGNLARSMRVNEENKRASAKYEQYRNVVSNGQKYTQNLMNLARSKGYTVNSKQVARLADNGLATFNFLVAGGLPATLLETAIGVQGATYTDKYKVRSNG